MINNKKPAKYKIPPEETVVGSGLCLVRFGLGLDESEETSPILCPMQPPEYR